MSRRVAGVLRRIRCSRAHCGERGWRIRRYQRGATLFFRNHSPNGSHCSPFDLFPVEFVATLVVRTRLMRCWENICQSSIVTWQEDIGSGYEDCCAIVQAICFKGLVRPPIGCVHIQSIGDCPLPATSFNGSFSVDTILSAPFCRKRCFIWCVFISLFVSVLDAVGIVVVTLDYVDPARATMQIK